MPGAREKSEVLLIMSDPDSPPPSSSAPSNPDKSVDLSVDKLVRSTTLLLLLPPSASDSLLLLMRTPTPSRAQHAGAASKSAAGGARLARDACAAEPRALRARSTP